MSDDNIHPCHRQAQECALSNESIRHLLNTLSIRGCPFDFDRHLACESSRDRLRGGFDRSTCQIVLYPENLHTSKEFCTIFLHELIHAYDYCRVKIDFNNPYHLACTEIRAATLSNQCSLFNHFSSSSRPFLVKKQHEICVQDRARESMQICTDLPKQKLDEIIHEVFPRCYKDTDPFDEFGTRGRRRI